MSSEDAREQGQHHAQGMHEQDTSQVLFLDHSSDDDGEV